MKYRVISHCRDESFEQRRAAWNNLLAAANELKLLPVQAHVDTPGICIDELNYRTSYYCCFDADDHKLLLWLLKAADSEHMQTLEIEERHQK